MAAIIGQVPIDVRIRVEARAPGGEYHEVGNVTTQVQLPLHAAAEQPDERAMHMTADATALTGLLDPVVDALTNLGKQAEESEE